MKYLLRLLLSVLLAFPLIWMLHTNMRPFIGGIKADEKIHFLVAWEDFDGDREEDRLVKPGAEENQEYFELWTKKNLLGLIRKKGNISKNSFVVQDLDADGTQDFLFVDCVNDSFFLNHYTMNVKNATLSPAYKKYFLSARIDKEYPYVFDKRCEDINSDGKKELLFIHCGGLNARGLYVYDVVKQTVRASATDFMMLTGLCLTPNEKNNEQQIYVSSYANGNVPPDKLNRAAWKCGMDTTKEHSLYSDHYAWLGRLDKNLVLEKNPVSHMNFTNMFRIAPLRKHKVASLFCLETNLNHPDSLSYAYLLSGELKIVQKKQIKPGISVERMTKYNNEVMFSVFYHNADRIFYPADADTLFEMDSLLNRKSFCVSKEINAGTKVRTLDADGDGADELFVSGRNGFFLFDEDETEPFFIETGYETIPRGSFHVKESNEGRINSFACQSGNVIRFTYKRNFWHPLRWIFYLFAVFVIFMLLWFYQRINARKLEKENARLEETVKQRTAEVELKNDLLSKQKELLEEKQKEILDSIHYAKRIQMSLMQNEKIIRKKLSKHITKYKN